MNEGIKTSKGVVGAGFSTSEKNPTSIHIGKHVISLEEFCLFAKFILSGGGATGWGRSVPECVQKLRREMCTDRSFITQIINTGEDEVVGRRVLIKSCHSEMHGSSFDGCVCELIGKEVVIERKHGETSSNYLYYDIEGHCKELFWGEFQLLE